MKAALISLGSTSSEWTAKAMEKYFDSVDMIMLKNIEISFTGKKYEILYEGKPLQHYDCIFAKGSFRYANLLSALTSMLNKISFMPIAPSAFTTAHDKLLTQLKLQIANIPMPKTFLTSTIKEAKNILENMNYPIIMKFPKGTQGKGVMFADSYGSASSILDALSVLKQPVLIQEYVETGSTDLRVIVIGNKVVASYRRKAALGEKRSNFHQGGVGEIAQIDSYTKSIAISAARAIKADICGVDILESAKGPLVLEVNISPGLQGVTKFTKIDVADAIAKFLYEKTKVVKQNENHINAKSMLVDLGIEDSTKNDDFAELITNLELRGNRILLPEMITKKTQFDDKSDVSFKFKKDKLEIVKF